MATLEAAYQFAALAWVALCMTILTVCTLGSLVGYARRQYLNARIWQFNRKHGQHVKYH